MPQKWTGLKQSTDTSDSCDITRHGRVAWGLGRSRAVKSCGPVSIADPGGSNSIVE